MDAPDDDFAEALRVFQITARRLVDGAPALRAAIAPSPALRRVAARSLQTDSGAARAFFANQFDWRPIEAPVFFTGYYEPEVAGSLTPTPEFTEPILARPADLVNSAPYPDRATIEDAGAHPLVWLADAVEVFMIQVQGSARVNLPGGRQVRLIYDGRNGKPYTSIGGHLIEAGEIAADEMSLARLKAWLRAQGLKPGERGRQVMRLNRSYIFFRREESLDPTSGPIGGAGAPLTPLRSLAVDRALWPYGLPFWVEAELPWRDERAEPLRRLMVGQDTGSAIVGQGRFDIFFGTGDGAGARAGDIRHKGAVQALLPRETPR